MTNRNDQVNHIGIFPYVVWTLSLAYFCETLNTFAGHLTTTLPKLTFAGDEAPSFAARGPRDLSIRHHMPLIGVTEAG